MFFLLDPLILFCSYLLNSYRPLIVYANHFAAVPLAVFLAHPIYKHPLPELLPLILRLPLPLLGYLKQSLLNVAMDKHRDARQHDVEVVLVLKDLLDEAPVSYWSEGFVRGGRHLRLIHQKRQEALPQLVVGGQEPDEKSSTYPDIRILSIFKQALDLPLSQMHEHHLVQYAEQR